MSDARPAMLIVGGTGSVGGAIAKLAAASGWRVIVSSRGGARLDATLAGLDASAGTAFGIAEDMLAPDGAVTVVTRALEWAGRIDAAVDCLTGGRPGIAGRFDETDPAAYSALYDASIVHLQRLTLAVLPHLRASGGALLAFASDAGRFAAPGQAMIAASRAAIIGFVRNLAVEVARDGVRVNCISPSYVEGTQSLERVEQRSPARLAKARRRAGLGLPSADDIAPLALFLCGSGARRITGQVISINGGLNA